MPRPGAPGRGADPLLPGAVEAVRTLATAWPLGLASSSNRPIIERFLDASGLRALFAVTVSSEEVARGKPAPDVYLDAARRLGVAPEQCVAVEDSTNGLHAAAAAGMVVIAAPNRDYPPEPDALGHAALVIGSLDELKQRVAEFFADRYVDVRLLVPHEDGGELSALYRTGAPITAREDAAEGVLVTARLPRELIGRFAAYRV